jgi:hypothetical protein
VPPAGISGLSDRPGGPDGQPSRHSSAPFGGSFCFCNLNPLVLELHRATCNSVTIRGGTFRTSPHRGREPV